MDKRKVREKAAAASGRGPVRITPGVADRIADDLDRRLEDVRERFPKLVEDCPHETRLAVAGWVVKAIAENAREGGSFRRLIYGRLGFGKDACVPLYVAEGQTITNELRLPQGEHDVGQTSLPGR